MFDWLLDRVKEPSTYAGLGVAVGGVGAAFDISEAPAVADALAGAAQGAAAGLPIYVWGPMVIGGIIAAFTGEKGRGR